MWITGAVCSFHWEKELPIAFFTGRQRQDKTVKDKTYSLFSSVLVKHTLEVKTNTESDLERETDRQKDRLTETDRQTQTDRQADRDRQAYRDRDKLTETSHILCFLGNWISIHERWISVHERERERGGGGGGGRRLSGFQWRFLFQICVLTLKESKGILKSQVRAVAELVEL